MWSEFSRRVIQNDNGTDHGSQGPMFVIGGVYHHSGDDHDSTDFRDVQR